MEGERPGEGSGSEQRLTSWKAIARYLGRDVRTAMRWERDAGMPVHRVPGRGSKSPVFAYPSELDAWLLSDAPEPAPPSPAPLPRWIAPTVAVGVTVGAVGLTLWPSRPGSGGSADSADTTPAVVTDFTPSGSVLTGLDRSGRAVLELNQPEGREFSERATAVRVWAPDGSRRWIVGANAVVAPGTHIEEGELFALDSGGAIAWRQRVTSSLRFGTETFGPPWVSEYVGALADGPRPRIVWAVRHETWWPSVLRVLGMDGKPLGEFVNAGWIQTAVVTHVGGSDLILAGGISNSRGSAMLAVLRADSVRGSSPEDDGSPFACTGCGPGGPERYLVFAPTEVSRASGVPYNRTLQAVGTDQGIQVWTQEGPANSDIAWVYLIAPDFRSVRAAPSDSYWARHDALHASGSLGHTAAECPERATPPLVRIWAPSTGWSDLPTQAAGPSPPSASRSLATAVQKLVSPLRTIRNRSAGFPRVTLMSRSPKGQPEARE